MCRKCTSVSVFSIDGESTEKVNITVPAEAESWPLLNLHPYTFYEFDMVAKNRAGLSVKSDLSDPNRTDEAGMYC